MVSLISTLRENGASWSCTPISSWIVLGSVDSSFQQSYGGGKQAGLCLHQFLGQKVGGFRARLGMGAYTQHELGRPKPLRR